MKLKLTSPFLTNKGGYTSSKANFYANVIKQICASYDSTLVNHVLVEKKLTQDGNSVDYVQLTPELSVDQIVELASKEGKYYAVSAWLREGIKAKDAILDSVRYATPDQLGFTLPVLSDYVTGLVVPSTIQVPSEDDVNLVIDRLNVAERADYLTLEAEASHIGKRIHNNGLFTSWRKQIVTFKPIEFLTPTANQTFVLNNKLRLNLEQLDTIVLRLQGEHRAVEAKLNGYKSRLKTLVQELIQQRQAEKGKAEVAYKEAQERYYQDHKIKMAEVEEQRSKTLVEASKLGIVIPHAHEAILKEVEEKIAYPDKENAADTEVA